MRGGGNNPNRWCRPLRDREIAARKAQIEDRLRFADREFDEDPEAAINAAWDRATPEQQANARQSAERVIDRVLGPRR